MAWYRQPPSHYLNYHLSWMGSVAYAWEQIPRKYSWFQSVRWLWKFLLQHIPGVNEWIDCVFCRRGWVRGGHVWLCEWNWAGRLYQHHRFLWLQLYSRLHGRWPPERHRLHRWDTGTGTQATGTHRPASVSRPPSQVWDSEYNGNPLTDGWIVFFIEMSPHTGRSKDVACVLYCVGSVKPWSSNLIVWWMNQVLALSVLGTGSTMHRSFLINKSIALKYRQRYNKSNQIDLSAVSPSSKACDCNFGQSRDQ